MADTISVVLTVSQFCALREAVKWDLGEVGSGVFQQKSPNKARPGKTSYRTMYRVEGTHAALRRLAMRAGAAPLSKAARNALSIINAALAPKEA